MHEQEKKRQYATRVFEIEKGTFTPLVFTTTGGMGEECLRCHRTPAELLIMKKEEDYAKTMNWIGAKISFSLIRSALACLKALSHYSVWAQRMNIFAHTLAYADLR